MDLVLTVTVTLPNGDPQQVPQVNVAWNQAPPLNNVPAVLLTAASAGVSAETAARIGGKFPSLHEHIPS